MSKQIIRLGLSLKKTIGQHNKLIGTAEIQTWQGTEKFHKLRQQSDESIALAKYLIQMLDNRHHAVLLANAAGMPGYINMR